MKKRILSLALCLCMVLTLLPTMALAADEETPAVKVAGVDVVIGGAWTTDPAGTLTETTGSDWNVKYEPDTSTLTLNNAVISGTGTNPAISVHNLSALTIELEGANTATSAHNYSGGNVGINASCALTIQGTGSLNVNCVDSSNGYLGTSSGIYAKSLTVTGGCTVTARSAKANSSDGVEVRDGNVMVSGSATLNAIGGDATTASYGVSAGYLQDTGDGTNKVKLGSVSVTENGTLNAVGGAVDSDSTGYSFGVSATQNVAVSGSGTLNAQGGRATGGTTSTGYAYSIGVSAGAWTHSSAPLQNPRSDGSVAITKNGTLNAVGGWAKSGSTENTNSKSFGIYVCTAISNDTDNFSVSGGSVTAVGGKSGGISAGISTDRNVLVSGGSVTATGGNSAVFNSYGLRADKLTINDGVVTSTGGYAAQYSCGVYAKTAVSGGSLTATGGMIGYYKDTTGKTKSGTSYGILSYSGAMTFTGGTVIAVGGDAYHNTGDDGFSYGVYGAAGVSGNAKVVAVGGAVDISAANSESISCGFSNGLSYSGGLLVTKGETQATEGNVNAPENAIGTGSSAGKYYIISPKKADSSDPVYTVCETNQTLSTLSNTIIIGTDSTSDTVALSAGSDTLALTGFNVVLAGNTASGVSLAVQRAGSLTLSGANAELVAVGGRSFLGNGTGSSGVCACVIEGANETRETYYPLSVQSGVTLTAIGGKDYSNSNSVGIACGGANLAGNVTAVGGSANFGSYGLKVYYGTDYPSSTLSGRLTGVAGSGYESVGLLLKGDVSANSTAVLTGVGSEPMTSEGYSCGIDSGSLSSTGVITAIGGTADSTFSCGIFTYNMAVTNGSVTAFGGTAMSGKSYAIRSDGGFTLSGGSVTAFGGAAGQGSSYGVSTEAYANAGNVEDGYPEDNTAAFTVSGGSLTAFGGTAGALSGNGTGCCSYGISTLQAVEGIQSGETAVVTAVMNTSFSGGSTTAVGGSGNNSYGISTAVGGTNADDNITAKVAVSGSAELTALGGAAAYSSGNSIGMYVYGENSSGDGTSVTNAAVSVSGTPTVTALGGSAPSGDGLSAGILCTVSAQSSNSAVDVSGGTVTAMGQKGFNCFGVWLLDAAGTANVTLSGGSLRAYGGTSKNVDFGIYAAGSTGSNVTLKDGVSLLSAGNTMALGVATYQGGTSSAIKAMPASGGSIAVSGGDDAKTAKEIGKYTEETDITDSVGTLKYLSVAGTVPAPAPYVPGDTTKTTTNPDGSTTTVVTKPDGSTTTTVKQPDGVATVTSADKNGSVTGATVTVPDTVQGDVPVSIPADLGKADGAVSAVVTYPDGTKETVVGNYSDGKINLNVGGSAAIEILDDFVPLASLPLTDIPSGAYYRSAVIWAAMNGITSGKTASAFAPDDACTRAETVTFLWRAMGSPEPTGKTCPFTDVSAEAYYYKAVLWAVEKGVTKGTSATTFNPNDTCTRAQVVTFQYRTAGTPAVSGELVFTDVAANAYYTDAVRWAVSEKITDGTTPTTFSPAQNCTRGQIVTFLYRQLGK